MESLRPLYANDPSVSAIHMTAADAAQVTKDMGLDPIPMIRAADYSCPGGVPCPYPGQPSDQKGYLVLATGAELLNAAPVPNTSYEVAASWVGEDGSLTGGVPAYPVRAQQPDGSFVAINPTDWVAPFGTSFDDSRSDFKVAVAVGGGCDKFERIDVSETSDAVSIRAFYRETTFADTVCTTELKIQDVDVHLDAPLGSRMLEGCDGSPVSYETEPPPGDDCRTAGQ